MQDSLIIINPPLSQLSQLSRYFYPASHFLIRLLLDNSLSYHLLFSPLFL